MLNALKMPRHRTAIGGKRRFIKREWAWFIGFSAVVFIVYYRLGQKKYSDISLSVAGIQKV
jgi:hypothetical protein